MSSAKWQPFCLSLNELNTMSADDLVLECQGTTDHYTDIYSSLTILFWYNIQLLQRKVQYRSMINTLRPRQDGRHFPDDIFKRILLNENV